MAECNFVECSSHETPNMYPNLRVVPLKLSQMNINIG